MTERSKEMGKGTPTVTTRVLNGDDIDAADDSNRGQEDRTWKAGIKARFPILSLCCLTVIIASIIGVIIVLVKSDGKEVDTWDSTTIRIRNRSRKAQINVSTWISILNFVMGKALAAMFAEAVAVSWWVDAMRGQTLGLLHYRWEVGQSVTKILTRKKIWGWICIASIAAVLFSALDSLLQQSSSTETRPLIGNATMYASIASTLPAGFSGITGAGTPPADVSADSRISQKDTIMEVVNITPGFNQIIQNYTIQAPIPLEIAGCPPDANGGCSVTFPGIGFSYGCTTERRQLNRTNPTVFGVNFQGGGFIAADLNTNWQVQLDTVWKDKSDTFNTGNISALPHLSCTLIPALVEYPVNITQGIATLDPANSSVFWTDASDQSVKLNLPADKIIKVLPELPYEANTVARKQLTVDSHSTLGGLVLAFNTLFGSSVTIGAFNNDTDSTDWQIKAVNGIYALQSMRFAKPGDMSSDSTMDNTFTSPAAAVMRNIRDIMFRSSLAIVQQNITDWTWWNIPGGNSYLEELTNTLPQHNASAPGQYVKFATVYKTNYVFLAIAVSLMGAALLCILPLYSGFWHLGRKVSLSPFEIARALHNANNADAEAGLKRERSVLDAHGEGVHSPLAGSNLSNDELIDLLGDKRVQYGEVRPNTLGLGLYERTNVPQKGTVYR